MRRPTSSISFVFPTVVSLTLISGIASMLIAAEPDPTEQQKRILESTSNTWLMGTGTIFGLLSGYSSSTAKIKYNSEEDSNE